eukprot:bmy_05829T0
MRGSVGSGIRVISRAVGGPPGVRTSEGIRIEFYLSFWCAWTVSLLGRSCVCLFVCLFSGNGSRIVGDQVDSTWLSCSLPHPLEIRVLERRLGSGRLRKE